MSGQYSSAVPAQRPRDDAAAGWRWPPPGRLQRHGPVEHPGQTVIVVGLLAADLVSVVGRVMRGPRAASRPTTAIGSRPLATSATLLRRGLLIVRHANNQCAAWNRRRRCLGCSISSRMATARSAAEMVDFPAASRSRTSLLSR